MFLFKFKDKLNGHYTECFKIPRKSVTYQYSKLLLDLDYVDNPNWTEKFYGAFYRVELYMIYSNVSYTQITLEI